MIEMIRLASITRYGWAELGWAARHGYLRRRAFAAGLKFVAQGEAERRALVRRHGAGLSTRADFRAEVRRECGFDCLRCWHLALAHGHRRVAAHQFPGHADSPLQSQAS